MTTPTPIEKAVSKEVAKTSPVWIRRDYIIVGVIITVLAVLSTVQIISLRRIEQSVKSTDVLEECFTPGTRCSEFSAESQRASRAYFAKLIADASLCTLITSGAVNTGEIPFTSEAIDTYYTKCVDDRTPPIPDPVGSGETS